MSGSGGDKKNNSNSNIPDSIQQHQPIMAMSANQTATAASEPMFQLASVSEQFANNNVYAEADASFASSTPPHVAFMNSIMNTRLNESAQNGIEMGQAALASTPINIQSVDASSVVSPQEKKRKKSATAPKQHQLPMFLTKTYHMIDRCDSEVATWSNLGDNFVVKDVEKFAKTILPMYFKHSNFSSFARQLNFYGFRKLKAEPILTADYDARTASYVRFFHEKFQKDKPELLYFIKRATKSDIQSKDDVESLRNEVQQLHETILNIQTEFDRKIAEMHYEFSSRITMLQQQQHTQNTQNTLQTRAAPINQNFPGQLMIQSSQQEMVPQTKVVPPKAVPPNNSQDRIQSLHQACLSLTSPAGPQPQLQGQVRIPTVLSLPPAQSQN